MVYEYHFWEKFKKTIQELQKNKNNAFNKKY